MPREDITLWLARGTAAAALLVAVASTPIVLAAIMFPPHAIGDTGLQTFAEEASGRPLWMFPIMAVCLAASALVQATWRLPLFFVYRGARPQRGRAGIAGSSIRVFLALLGAAAGLLTLVAFLLLMAFVQNGPITDSQTLSRRSFSLSMGALTLTLLSSGLFYQWWASRDGAPLADSV